MLTMSEIYHASETAMSEALDRFYQTFPEIDGIALDTIRDFAHERFTAAVTLEKVLDPRFKDQAPQYAYRLLVQEAVKVRTALIND